MLKFYVPLLVPIHRLEREFSAQKSPFSMCSLVVTWGFFDINSQFQDEG